VSTALRDLPKFLVLAGVSTVRIEMRLQEPACEIDVELENPRPGRSFVLLIGHPEGPYVQRVRLSGKARIHFDPQAPGDYVLLLANPNREPLVLRLRGRDLGNVKGRSRTRRGRKPSARLPSPKRIATPTGRPRRRSVRYEPSPRPKP
jgi:hypothetical protein